MKHANEQTTGFWTPRPPALDAVLARIESLLLKPEFALQREIALARALRPYLEGMAGRLVAPLAQETELVTLCLLCDFYPEDGQLTLIEQLRDVITEHIPDEERRWLDPLKHSYLDLLELTSLPKPGEDLTLRSLGDRSVFVVPGDESINGLAVDRVLLTRIVLTPDSGESSKAAWAGCGIVLSQADAHGLLEMAAEWRREMEMTTGSSALGEWKESLPSVSGICCSGRSCSSVRTRWWTPSSIFAIAVPMAVPISMLWLCTTTMSIGFFPMDCPR